MTDQTSKTQSKTIKTLTGDPSKAEEIAYIEKIASTLPDNTYLKSFFTKDLVAWVSEQIHNDFGCDLYGTLQEEWNRTSRMSTEYNKAFSEKDNEIKVLNSTIEDLATEMARLNEARNQATQMAEKYSAKYQEAWNTACDATREASDKDNQVAMLEAKIISLKVRIYDLEHQEA